ncbi:hypothetical protein ACEU6E_01165 [Halorutilales archaeon Cl-col2-1]
METKIDRVKILYVVGVVLGVAAAFYFGFQLLEDLSPTTTSAALVLGFAAFFLAGVYVDTETLDTVFYALSAGSYLVFVAYTLSVFDLGDGGVFLLLAGSSALFVVLGYVSSRGYLDVDRRTAAAGIVGVLVVAFVLLGFDVTGAQTTYEYDFDDEVELPEGFRPTNEDVVGTVTVENPFALSRTAEVPSVNGCVYISESEYRPAPVRDNAPFDLLLSGGETRRYNITLRQEAFLDRDTGEIEDAFADRETVPLEVSEDCPDEVDEPKVVVVVDDGDDTSVRSATE